MRETKSDWPTGPAHAVYFATYEVVKQAMGGNASGHHPVAAGMSSYPASSASHMRACVLLLTLQLHSLQWRLRDNCQRCLYEPL